MLNSILHFSRITWQTKSNETKNTLWNLAILTDEIKNNLNMRADLLLSFNRYTVQNATELFYLKLRLSTK